MLIVCTFTGKKIGDHIYKDTRGYNLCDFFFDLLIIKVVAAKQVFKKHFFILPVINRGPLRVLNLKKILTLLLISPYPSVIVPSMQSNHTGNSREATALQ